MEIGTKLVADTAEARLKGLYCGQLNDGQVYVVSDIFYDNGLTFSVEGIPAHVWSVEPDAEGDSYKQFFKLSEV